MFSRRLASPFIFIALAMAYWSYRTGNSDLAYWLIIPLSILATIYVLQYEIDWWWAKDHPPALHPQQEKAVRLYTPFYAQLNPKGQKRFRDRVALFLLWNDFIGKNNEEKVPDDIQAVIGAQYVQLTFGWDNFLIDDFQRIVVYNHAFGSPALRQLHSSELHVEDGVFLFHLERMMLGIAKPRQAYNLVINEYVEAIQIARPQLSFPKLSEDIWPQLAKIRGFDKDYILKFTGKNEVSPLQASIEHFFVFPQSFQKELPELYEHYVELFNISRLKEYA